jgi:adenine-specific DNA-methyltransferase
MTEKSLGNQWSERFGLARSPMFSTDEESPDGEHDILLDGGYGSFGLSLVDEGTNPLATAGWAWSSDVPHHVTVTGRDVQVVRWDAVSESQRYSRQSIDRDLDGFYRYLCRDRLRSNRSVVQHLVSLFGRIRALVAHAGLPDERAIDAFITVLGDLIAGAAQPANVAAFGLPEDAADLRQALSSGSLHEVLRDIRTAPAALSAITLHPSLAIRHAGGQLFQEAHFDLVRAPPPDLFGFVESVTTQSNSSRGTHFTPPALARSIVDQTIAQIDDLHTKRTLIISDPACGSAAFLHEALRGLRRVGFKGAVTVIGRDISASAISMARFTLTLALRDWQPGGGATLDLAVGDSLAERAFPKADITVMNPPFISVIAQTSEQKAQLRAVVGERVGSRGDYSMAFVARAAEALAEGGVLGTLFPANLLTHEAATPWREWLTGQGEVRLLASIGDFGLFSQALVHVACLVLAKRRDRRPEFTALVTGNEPAATGDALRELRKTHGFPPATAVGDRHWRLFATPRSVLQRKLPWRILTPEQRNLIDALEAAQTPTAGSLFNIAQGVQTGNLKLFLFDEERFSSMRLPAKERAYFRDALMTDSVENGRIVKTYHLFFPHGPNGPLFRNEAEVAAAVPNFYKAVLKPNETDLRKRASIVSSGRQDWWGLMRPRTNSFAFSTKPRIVSKFFGAEGSFVLDEKGRYLPSTGHVWMPAPAALEGFRTDVEEETLEEVYDAPSLEVMRAYTMLLNSRAFIRLVSFRSVIISGGQFDLSNRFIDPVFLPNLWEKAKDPKSGEIVRRLALLSNKLNEPIIEGDVERMVARLYGVPELAEA